MINVNTNSTLLKLKVSIISFFVIIFTFLLTSQCFAYWGLYEDCVLPWELGKINRTYVTVSPVGKRCKDICADQCSKFSNVTKGKSCKDCIIGAELNNDIIDECMMKCQSGDQYNNQMRVPSDNDDFLPWKKEGDQKIDAMCRKGDSSSDLSADYAYFSSAITVKNGDEISVYLGNPKDELGNNVYLCGFKTVLIKPSYFGLDKNTFQNQSGWNVRNFSAYYTGIQAKDGDYLNIIYGGKYLYDFQNGSYKKNDKSISVAPNNQPFSPPQFKLPSNDLWKVDINITTDSDGNPTDAKMSQDPSKVYDHNKSYVWKGLNPRAYTNTRKSVKFSDGSKHDNYSFDVFSYSGYLDQFSSNRADVYLSYLNQQDLAKFYAMFTAAGGFVVQMKWRGCRHTNGELLQYAIAEGNVSEDTGENEYNIESVDDWQNVDFDKDTNTAKFKPQKSGMLFFKIDNRDSEGTHPRANSTGQYKLIVHKDDKNEGNPLTNVLADLVNYIREIFVGDGGEKQGRVQVIFNNLVKDSDIINAIRALLVFYIAFTGLSFMIGVSPITQQEAIIRVFKIAIVIILISPQSWEFFNTYLFQIVMGAAMELIAKICAPFYERNVVITGNIEDMTKAVFSMFDTPIKTLFAPEIWIKIWALVLTSLLGFAFAIIVIISIVLFFICIIKATMIYIVSIITMSILFILAPLFISLILFKRTNQMFNYWIYQFFGIILQPVLVFTAISILFKVFQAALYAALSFAACKICWFGFYIPVADWDICIIPGYMALYGGHFPPMSPFDAPVRMLSPIICLILVAQGMYALSDFASQLGALIATQGYAGFDLASAAKDANPINLLGKYKDGALAMVGMNQSTRQKRAGIVKEQKENQAKKQSKEKGKNDSKDKSDSKGKGSKGSSDAKKRN